MTEQVFKYAFLLLTLFRQFTASENFTPDHYLGFKSPGEIPVIFAPEIISGKNFEFAITISPDNKEVFFTRRDAMESSNNRIYTSKFENGKLSIPKPAEFAMDCIESMPYITPEGDKIFFHSERPQNPNNKINKNDEKIWYSEKTNGKWGKPQYLKGIINTGFVMGIAAAKSNTLYLCGEVGGKDGLLKSKPDNGEYKEVSLEFQGLHPYISPDEQFIIYDLIEDNTGEKTALYIAFKEKNGKWGKNRRLGNIINKSGNECFGRFSPDGNYFFFHRNGDIYWVNSKVVLEN